MYKRQLLNLCGLSLGAVLALNYAIDFPKKVNSLILIAPQYEDVYKRQPYYILLTIVTTMLNGWIV